MADNDQSLYVLRYNQISQTLEGQGGTPAWNPLVLSVAVDAQDAPYTPTTPADWGLAVPTTVQQALDTLASLINISEVIIFEGDSITFNGGYRALVFAELTGVVQMTCFATNGAGIATLVTRGSQVDALYDASRTNVLSVLIGANDLPSLGAATWKANLKAYCQARQLAGWKVVLLTVLPQTTPGFNTIRNAANDLIYGDPTFYDALADVAADPTIGADAAASDLTYYSDGEHPTQAANIIIAPYVTAAIQAIP